MSAPVSEVPSPGSARSPVSSSVASSVTARRLLRAQKRSLVRTPKPVTGELVDAAYEGEHNEAGQPEGRGKMDFSSGEVYVGDFKAGRIEGCGTMTFTSGDVYTGEFRNDMMDGRGTYRLADGEAMVGRSQEDAPVGEGAMWSPECQWVWIEPLASVLIVCCWHALPATPPEACSTLDRLARQPPAGMATAGWGACRRDIGRRSCAHRRAGRGACAGMTPISWEEVRHSWSARPVMHAAGAG